MLKFLSVLYALAAFALGSLAILFVLFGSFMGVADAGGGDARLIVPAILALIPSVLPVFLVVILLIVGAVFAWKWNSSRSRVSLLFIVIPPIGVIALLAWVYSIFNA